MQQGEGARDGRVTQGAQPSRLAIGGAVDTDMLAGIDVPKASAAIVAEGILDGLAAGHEDIFPDPVSRQMAATWWSDPKAFERAFAGA